MTETSSLKIIFASHICRKEKYISQRNTHLHQILQNSVSFLLSPLFLHKHASLIVSSNNQVQDLILACYKLFYQLKLGELCTCERIYFNNIKYKKGMYKEKVLENQKVSLDFLVNRFIQGPWARADQLLLKSSAF